MLEHVFGELTWVEGELSDLSRSRAGHVYFDLVDAGHDGPDSARPTLAVTLFNTDRLRVNQFLTDQGGAVRMTDGIRVRIGGRLRTYPARSTVQLVMDRIDPAFTLGLLGQDRIRLLAALTQEDLLRANGRLPMAALPLHVGLVTSGGSAAQADAVDELAASGFGFRVSFLDARTQGADAATSIVSALRTAAAVGVDVVLLVRGGGAATDLATFDAEVVARAIAASTVPVITGIGHEVDRSVADEVAHTAHKTPTAAAAALVQAVGRARADVHDGWVAVQAASEGRLVRADQRLVRTGHRTGTAALRLLDRHGASIDAQVRRARTAGRRVAAADRASVDDLARRLGPAASRVLERAGQEVGTLGVRAAVHDPATAHARGWSVTRTVDGRPVRSIADVTEGDTITTTLADGTVRSTVVDTDGGTPTRPTDRQDEAP